TLAVILASLDSHRGLRYSTGYYTAMVPVCNPKGPPYRGDPAMRVNLLTLQDHPRRDFRLDPINAAHVEQLRASIREHDFWGGVACRQLEDGTLQIAAGHHRVYAARAEGMTEADLFVSPRPVSDEEMARLYAQENATQRGVSTHALTGSVAAALSV